MQVSKSEKCFVTAQDSKNSNRVMVTFFFSFFFSLHHLRNIAFVLEFFLLKKKLSRVLNQLFQWFAFEFTVSIRLIKETLEKFLLIELLQQRTISSFVTMKKIVITLICILEITKLKGYRQLVPVVQRLDNAIHRINHYPADKC